MGQCFTVACQSSVACPSRPLCRLPLFTIRQNPCPVLVRSASPGRCACCGNYPVASSLVRSQSPWRLISCLNCPCFFFFVQGYSVFKHFPVDYSTGTLRDASRGSEPRAPRMLDTTCGRTSASASLVSFCKAFWFCLGVGAECSPSNTSFWRNITLSSISSPIIHKTHDYCLIRFTCRFVRVPHSQRRISSCIRLTSSAVGILPPPKPSSSSSSRSQGKEREVGGS